MSIAEILEVAAAQIEGEDHHSLPLVGAWSTIVARSGHFGHGEADLPGEERRCEVSTFGARSSNEGPYIGRLPPLQHAAAWLSRFWLELLRFSLLLQPRR